MAVGAAELDGLAIDLDDLMIDADGANTHAGGDLFLIGQQSELIQVGLFGVPQLGLIDLEGDLAVRGLGPGDGFTGKGEHGCDLGRTDGLQVHGHGAVQLGLHEEIADVFLGTGQQVHIAEDAAHAELILVLGIGSGGPLEDQHADVVIAIDELFGDVKLGGGVRHGGEADVSAVDPYEVGRIHTFKIQVIGHAGDLIHGELAHIQGAGVLIGNIGRVIGDGVADVGILMVIIAVHLPHGRHLHGHQVGAGFDHAFLKIGNAVKEAEAPGAGEHGHAVGSGALQNVGGLGRKVGDVVRAVFFRTFVQKVRIFQISLEIHK